MSSAIARNGLCGLLLVMAGAGLCATPAVANPPAGHPDKITLQGVFRDFRSSNNTMGGHPDFDPPALANGRGLYMAMVKDSLNTLGSVEFNTTGHKVSVCAQDKHGNNIVGPKVYIASDAGDTAGTMSNSEDLATVSAASFAQWFNETPSALSSQTVSITLARSGSLYSFDAEPRTEFVKTIGDAASKNWGYTFELACDFYYDSARHDTIVCGADDAMWVFIDGKLVVDLGGCHDYMEQSFEVDRLQGLVNGQKYQMKIFYAEREKNDSRLKFQTSLMPVPVNPPAVAGLYD